VSGLEFLALIDWDFVSLNVNFRGIGFRVSRKIGADARGEFFAWHEMNCVLEYQHF